MKKGELVVSNTHPYCNGNAKFKISGYADYTSPVLNIIELKPGKFDSITGEKLGNHLHVIYYDSKNGKFVKKWINDKLLSSDILRIDIDPFFKEISLKDDAVEQMEIEFRENYLYKKVTLRSVEVELNKIKVNRSIESGKLSETNHLEFLPPIMSVIGLRIEDKGKKYCVETGNLMFEMKCKWYNSATKSFSEEFFPAHVLYLVKDTAEIIENKDLLSDMSDLIESNNLISIGLQKGFLLENSGNNEVEISKTLLEPQSIYFHHYYYRYQAFDFVLNKQITKTINQNFIVKSDSEIWGSIYPSYVDNVRKVVNDCLFSDDEYFYLHYKDLYGNITKRIVKITSRTAYIKDFEAFLKTYKIRKTENVSNLNYLRFIISKNGKVRLYFGEDGSKSKEINVKNFYNDDNLEVFVVANCLLRQGKIRNFRVKGILSISEINNGKELFEKNE